MAFPMKNAEIAARDRDLKEQYGTRSVGTGLGSVWQSYTFGRYQVRWHGEDIAEVIRADLAGEIVYSGTKADCLEWAKARC